MKEELCKLDIQCSKFKPSLCYYQNSNSLDGILIIDVNDFCWGWTENCRDSIIRPLKYIFPIGTGFEQSFRYLGLNIIQKQNFKIKASSSMKLNLRERMKNKLDPLNENELRSYQTLIGQLSWIAN